MILHETKMFYSPQLHIGHQTSFIFQTKKLTPNNTTQSRSARQSITVKYIEWTFQEKRVVRNRVLSLLCHTWCCCLVFVKGFLFVVTEPQTFNLQHYFRDNEFLKLEKQNGSTCTACTIQLLQLCTASWREPSCIFVAARPSVETTREDHCK